MSYKNIETQRASNRLRVARNRNEWFKDKVCVTCGTSVDLELDHIDPSLKVSHRIWSWSEHRRNEELKKCQPLCETHHKLKTAKERKWQHGESTTGYHHGCRCEPCKQAFNAKKRAYRAAGGVH
jgi:hypothetical protein